MRRASREIVEPQELDAILSEARILFLALRDEPAPYVLPVCFGHEPAVLYIHCAREGSKIDLLRAWPEVGFSACTDMTVIPGAAACDFTCRARSVIGTGHARVVESNEERVRGLTAIMRHYETGPAAERPVFAPGPVSRTCVIAIRIDSLRGKRIG